MTWTPKRTLRMAVAAALLAAIPATAQELPTCDTSPDLLRGPALLRALSLDLRGVVPSAEEYGLLDAAGEVPEAVIDAWMATEGFVERTVRRHDDLLWPNVGDIRLMSNRQRLSYDYDQGVYYRYLVAPNYRGGPVPCGDFPAEYDEDGALITSTTPEGWLQEGWVEVEPYWNPGVKVRVCAFEAQTAEVSPWGTACDTYDSRFDPYCGCGPNLRWCDTFTLGHVQEEGVTAPVHRGIAEDVRRRVGRVMERDLSYMELFTSRVAYVNGPLSHFYRYQTQLPAHIRFNELPIDPDLMPDLAFTDEDTWVEVELGEEQAGILTSPLYLMKFQTRRARTNRFYNAFLCQPFQAPDTGIPNVSTTSQTLNLRQRPGCDSCHALLEPAGAHWARWGEYGAGWLDPERFPDHDPACFACAEDGTSCPESCAQYYVIDPLTSEEDPYVGGLSSLEFLEDRHADNPLEGPSQLAWEGVVDGRLPRCVARRTVEWLLGRSPDAWEDAWVDELADGFVASDLRYRQLVKAIVLSDNYRRAR
jgi:hypothetical protein